MYDVTQITDDFMLAEQAKTKEYTLVLLKTTPDTFTPEGRSIIWEHGRRNFALRADGVLAIVCPVTDGSEIAGVGIFDAPPECDEGGPLRWHDQLSPKTEPGRRPHTSCCTLGWISVVSASMSA